MNSLLIELVLAVLTVVPAITLHEAAHGYAAWALGDDTARRAGRLSLNPLVHVDRVGTVLLPGALILVQLLAIGRVQFLFGWAKPVPVDARVFRDPRRGMALVAAAGPACNFVLAWLAALAAHLLPFLPVAVADVGELLIESFIVANLVLGLINLLPIPPLDGGRIVVGILPLGLARAWAGLERAGLVIVLLLLVVLPPLLGEFGIRFDPVRALLGRVLPYVYDLVTRAALL